MAENKNHKKDEKEQAEADIASALPGQAKEQEKKHEKEAQKSSNQTELEEKAKLVDDYLDQLQRVQADFENYRKRTIKDKEDFRKYALEGFAYGLLDIVDNFQRAIDASTQNHSYESLVSGINIVEKQFIDLLKSQGIKPIQVKIGDKFDPHAHHAVNHEPDEEVPPEHILKIMQAGYTISERILRPAMVIISSGPKKTEEPKK